MNKLRLAGPIWLASDIHLGPQTPATQRVFHAFLDQARTQADSLLLCGDVFDAWIGDDLALNAPPSWLAQTLQKLNQVATTIPLWLGRGNRDFLMGPQLAQHLGARLLPDTCCLVTDFGDILLSHGDEYCTDDHAYQRFRRIVRNPVVQRLFLSLNLNLRRKIAQWARSRSMAANHDKSMHIMDVAPHTIAHAFNASGIHMMVHGHTHRPAIHSVQIGAQSCTRIVLPDWDYDHAQPPRGGWLCINQSGAQFSYPPGSASMTPDRFNLPETHHR
ncbi:MAG: UDP-2,3-diacylglucosamine diphosphatase [Paralcaligenes sp.]